jgi:hypothetical protein
MLERKHVVKITTTLVISILIMTIYSALQPAIATPSESDVVNTSEISNTIIVGGDKIYMSEYVRNYVPGTSLEVYYNMYEYDTSTDTKTFIGLGIPISASQDYLVYRYYYYKRLYIPPSTTQITTYYVRDLSTNINTAWNSAGYGNPCDIWGHHMVSTLRVMFPKVSNLVYVTDLTFSPYTPVFMTAISSAPSISAVAAASVQIGGDYIAWTESTPRTFPVSYPYTLNYYLYAMNINFPGSTPTVLHMTSATWLSPFAYSGKRINFNTMDDKIVVWTEYDLSTRTYESKYIDIMTFAKTSFSTKRIMGVNIANDLIYYGVYNSATRKTVIYEYDKLNYAETNTGITGYLDNAGNGVDKILAMRTLERQFGSDLNNDGDTRDTVVRYIRLFIPATINIDPDTLNLESNGNWITVYIDLPTGYDVNDIAFGTIMLDNTIPAEWCDVQSTTLMVKFDRLDVENLIGMPQEDVELTVTGKLNNGPYFSGQDTINAINP